jgi:hypothetical protein
LFLNRTLTLAYLIAILLEREASWENYCVDEYKSGCNDFGERLAHCPFQSIPGKPKGCKQSANKNHPAIIPAQAEIHGLALRLSRYFISMQLPNRDRLN